MQKNCWGKDIFKCPSQFTLFGYLPTNGVGIIAGCRIAVRIQRRLEPRTPRQVFTGGFVQISMAARTCDLTISYPTIGIYGQPEARCAFPLFTKGARRIVVRIGPASGITTRLRVRPLGRWRRWWWCRWRRNRCWRWRRGRNRTDHRPWRSHRCNDGRRRNHWRGFNRLVWWRWRWLLRFFWWFFLINVDHIQLRCNLLDGSIS